MKTSAKSTIMLFMTAIIWGFAFVAQRVAADNSLGSFTFNGTRFLLGAISLIPVFLIFEKDGKDRKKLIKTIWTACVGGTILFLASFLQQKGIEISGSASKGGFITALYMVIVPIIGMFFGKKTGLPVWLGVFLAVFGLYLLSFVELDASSRQIVSKNLSEMNLGDLVLLIGSVLWAVHILWLDKMSKEVSPIKFSSFQYLVCGILGIIFAGIFEQESLNVARISACAIPILYGGIMSVGVAYTLQIIGQKNADPTHASIILSTEAVFSVIGEALILHTYLNPVGYVGCVIIFIGTLLPQFTFKKKRS